MYIYVPTSLQYDPETKNRHNYFYLTQRGGCTSHNADFVKFFTKYVHESTTDDLDDEELRRWIHDNFEKGFPHPMVEYIRNLYEQTKHCLLYTSDAADE